MRLRDAKKLNNMDQVQVRMDMGGWEYGYVLGSPRLVTPKLLILPVLSTTYGLRHVSHTDVR